MQTRFRMTKEFPPVLKRSRGITTSWNKDARGEYEVNEVTNVPCFQYGV